jgi:hypothetical protein
MYSIQFTKLVITYLPECITINRTFGLQWLEMLAWRMLCRLNYTYTVRSGWSAWLRTGNLIWIIIFSARAVWNYSPENISSYVFLSLLRRQLLFPTPKYRSGERNDCRQHINATHTLPTQRKIPIGRNQCACQSNLICSNYAINNFQTECWFYK